VIMNRSRLEYGFEPSAATGMAGSSSIDASRHGSLGRGELAGGLSKARSTSCESVAGVVGTRRKKALIRRFMTDHS
jgi:hypothetical protein